MVHIHPVSVGRFPSFRTQPLANLSVDSVTNGFLSNPAPGENLVSGNLVMETGCNDNDNNDTNDTTNTNRINRINSINSRLLGGREREREYIYIYIYYYVICYTII